jgi:hypothetical protein
MPTPPKGVVTAQPAAPIADALRKARKSSSHRTRRWREMDSSLRFQGSPACASSSVEMAVCSIVTA